MANLISRQAVIEIIQSMYPGMPRTPWMREDWQKRYEPYIRTENAIRELPSAQPEIIRCKDCKYCDRGIDEDGNQFLQCFGWVGTQEDDFCSHAERRTDD